MSSFRNEYEDILEPRRLEISNWFWASRTLHIKYPVTIQPRPTPGGHKKAVLSNPKIIQLIKELCQSRNVKKEEIVEEIAQILDEIGYKKNLKIIRWLGIVLTKICVKVCSGIYVNHQGVDQLKQNMGSCPVIYVPTHRSYADFLLLSYVCFTYDLALPAIAAAMDFHGMMGMGEILRHSGAFYINRTANNDPVYWSVFKEYIHQLVSKGDDPIEFFIEGTRSRSNKSLTPKYGLILMILKAFFMGHVPDIQFVPVSINYDRILEESLFSFEMLGIPKPKESTSGFFKSLKIIKEKFGNMYVHCDTPISAREFLGTDLDRTGHQFGPQHSHELTDEEKSLVPPLAYEIVRRQQVSTVLHYFNLISLVLNNNLTRGQSFVDRQELTEDVEEMRNVLQSWGAKVFEDNTRKAIDACLEVHSNLIYEENGKIGLVSDKTVVGPLNPNKLKAHALSQETITYSVPFIMLQLYVNPVLHYLVDAALIVIILKSPGSMTKEELFEHFYTLRSMFSAEFVLSESWYRKNFEEVLIRLLEQKIITISNHEYGIFENHYLEDVLISSIQPFILSYVVATEVLQKTTGNITEKSLLASIQKVLEDVILERRIFIHPYCMSLDTLSNCLFSFTNKKLLTKNRRDGQTVYQANQEKILQLKADLDVYIPSFQVHDICLYIRSKI